VQERLAVVEEVDAAERRAGPSDGQASSTTRLKSSKSSMPAWRVRLMPVSGAQQACSQEMLQAAVVSIYSRDGSAATVRSRCGGS
jgi:hypothetical protein